MGWGKSFEEDAPIVFGATDAESLEALGVIAARPKAKDMRLRNENGMGRVTGAWPAEKSALGRLLTCTEFVINKNS